MKDYVLELCASQKSFNAKLNVMREYLQAYVLKILHEEGFFRSNAFLGGTALRFLYGLPRFSEDLDFSLEKKESSPFDKILGKIKQELVLAGYDVSISFRGPKNVKMATVKFEKLMHEASLSPLKNQRFSVKLEVDTSPPRGAGLKTQIVNKYFPIAFLSHDLNSLFAGKLIALLARKYTKGRDFFDLGWYLSRWKDLSPNMALFQNGLRQASWQGALPRDATWRGIVHQVVRRADWKRVREDVGNFLENPSDLNIFTQENVLQLIGAMQDEDGSLIDA